MPCLNASTLWIAWCHRLGHSTLHCAGLRPLQSDVVTAANDLVVNPMP